MHKIKIFEQKAFPFYLPAIRFFFIGKCVSDLFGACLRRIRMTNDTASRRFQTFSDLAFGLSL